MRVPTNKMLTKGDKGSDSIRVHRQIACQLATAVRKHGAFARVTLDIAISLLQFTCVVQQIFFTAV